MAIIVNNPADTRESSGSEAVSWMLAVAVIIILGLGAYYILPRLAYRAPAPAAQQPGANINVTLPAGNNGGNTGGSPANGTNNPAQ